MTHSSHKVTAADMIKGGGEYHRVMLAGEAVVVAINLTDNWLPCPCKKPVVAHYIVLIEDNHFVVYVCGGCGTSVAKIDDVDGSA